MNRVFLEDLPRRKGKNNQIDWNNSIGYKVRFIYDDIEGWVEIIDYDGKDLYVKYKDEYVFEIFTGRFKDCKFGKILGVKTGEFKIEIGTIFKDDKRDLAIIDRERRTQIDNSGRKNNWKWYKYYCNKCSNKRWIREDSIIKGTGCPCSKNHKNKSFLGNNKIWYTDRWMCDLGVSEEDAKKYTKGSNKKINVICPDCGREKTSSVNAIHQTKSIGCICGDGQSYPSKLCFSLLENLNIDFSNEYCPDWIKPRKYDFYFELNNEKYIVEAHGRQHYDGGFERCGGRSLKEEQENDKVKKQLALQNGIKDENYIVINCRKSELEWIKGKILKSILSELFDLSSIDWNKCEEFALSNRVKEACEIKRNNPYMTTGEIAKFMKLGKRAVSKYLKKGTELGWCNYDPEKEWSYSLYKTGIMIGKRVEMFKNGISIKVFDSVIEIERQSEKLFGFKLDRSTISKVCRGKSKHHKGFTFKYI